MTSAHDDHSDEVLQRALNYSSRYIHDLDSTPVGPRAELDELRERLGRPLPADAMAPLDVIDRLVADVEAGITGSSGGRFFGWVIGGSLPAALAADWLTSAWDQNAGMYSVAPAAAVVEEVCGRWLTELLGLPESCSFALVTGCQMAHFTCLAAARNALLARQNWDVEEKGLFGAPPIRVISGDQRHGTIERALRMLGLGRDCVTDLAVQSNGQLGSDTLEAALREDRSAANIVLLQAGDLNTGSFDSFHDLVPIAHEYGAWVHVDGAFGLWASASDEFRGLTDGIEQADSWATDGHKWLNVPYDCGYAFVADRVPHYRSMAHRADYLQYSDSARDQVDWNPEYSRRARGFATYAAIANLGKSGIADLVDRCCRHAATLVKQAGELPNVQVVSEPIINQGLLRFLDPATDATDSAHDARTELVTQRINCSGEAFFSPTTWRDMRCMRVSVTNWRTNDGDIHRVLSTMNAVLSEIDESPPSRVSSVCRPDSTSDSP